MNASADLAARGLPIAALLLALPVAAGCDPTYHARLDDGAGLGEGSPVLVSGVRVGQVEGVRVVEGQVDVELSIDGEHEVTLRADACAMAVPRPDEGPALLVAPGEGEPLPEDGVIPQCEPRSAQLGDLIRGLGEGLGNLMGQLFGGGAGGGGSGGSGGSGGAGGSGGGGAGGSPFPFPFPTPGGPSSPPAAPAPGSPPSPPSPSPPTADDPPPPPPPVDGSACAAVRIRVARVERADPVPLLLPDGGHRVLLDFDNRGDEAVEIGPLSETTFADDRNRALHPARVPSETRGWFMPFTVPAHGTATRSVLFGGEEPPRLDRVEARRSSPASSPMDACTVRQSGLAEAAP